LAVAALTLLGTPSSGSNFSFIEVGFPWNDRKNCHLPSDHFPQKVITSFIISMSLLYALHWVDQPLLECPAPDRISVIVEGCLAEEEPPSSSENEISDGDDDGSSENSDSNSEE
jgi:hypothetical protein